MVNLDFYSLEELHDRCICSQTQQIFINSVYLFTLVEPLGLVDALFFMLSPSLVGLIS